MNTKEIPINEYLLKVNPRLTDEDVERVATCLIDKLFERVPTLGDTLTKKEEEPIKMRDVCRLLQISDTTARSWMSKSVLPFHRKGTRVYFFKSEILKSLEQPFSSRKEGKRC